MEQGRLGLCGEEIGGRQDPGRVQEDVFGGRGKVLDCGGYWILDTGCWILDAGWWINPLLNNIEIK